MYGNKIKKNKTKKCPVRTFFIGGGAGISDAIGYDNYRVICSGYLKKQKLYLCFELE